MTRPHFIVSEESLASIEHDVESCAKGWLLWKHKLSRSPESAGPCPILFSRHIAGKTTFDALRSLTPSEHDASRRDALVRWVATLVEGRLLSELDVALAKELESANIVLEDASRIAWREMWKRVLSSQSTERANAYIEPALRTAAPQIAAISNERSLRRIEIAARLGLERPDALSMIPFAAIVESASLFLARTEDVTRAMVTRARRRSEAFRREASPLDAVLLSVGRDANVGWPARLTSRWLGEIFRDLATGLRIQFEPSPWVTGASSFARTLGAFGRSVRTAAATRTWGFALGNDPFFSGAYRFGCVFGGLVASPAFHKRVLGTGADVAREQARTGASMALLYARLEAARTLLSLNSSREHFEEVTARTFFLPMPEGLVGAWPVIHDDQSARAMGWMTAYRMTEDLVQRFDEDWFHNPHAIQHLRALASAPAHEVAVDFDGAAAMRALGNAFESVLG